MNVTQNNVRHFFMFSSFEVSHYSVLVAWDALMTFLSVKNIELQFHYHSKSHRAYIYGYFQGWSWGYFLIDSFANYMAGVDPRRKWETCRATWRECQQLALPGRLMKCQHEHISAFTCPITGPVSHSVQTEWLTDWWIPLAIAFRSAGQTCWH